MKSLLMKVKRAFIFVRLFYLHRGQATTSDAFSAGTHPGDCRALRMTRGWLSQNVTLFVQTRMLLQAQCFRLRTHCCWARIKYKKSQHSFYHLSAGTHLCAVCSMCRGEEVQSSYHLINILDCCSAPVCGLQHVQRRRGAITLQSYLTAALGIANTCQN